MSSALDLFPTAPPPVDETGPGFEEGDDEFVIPDFSQFVAGYEFDFANVPVRPAPILRLNGHTICTPGNIANIQAKPKEGKTAIAGGILSAVIVGQRGGCDTLGFSSDNPQGGWVLTFDSEQPFYNNDSNIRLALKRARHEDKMPPWLRSFCLTELSNRERCQFIFAAMEWAAGQPAGLFMVIIDGIADLCGSVNDAEESDYIIQQLHKKAIKYNCGIITVLHENPGSEIGKMRGHLGSQLERKAETALRISKDTKTGIVTIWTERARHCMIPKSEGQCIQYDTEKHCFVSCESAKELKDQEKLEKFRQVVEAVFGDDTGLGHTALCNKFAEVTGLSYESGKKRVKEWLALGLINHLGDVYVKCSTAGGVKV